RARARASSADRLAAGRAAVDVEQDVAASMHVAGVGVAVLAARERREVLPAEDQPGRPVGVLEDRLPAGDRLVRVGRAYDVQPGDGPQRGQVLDRLVGRAVLAEADGV